jgi:glycerophosphoryl diester phosphodiesterase
VYEYGMVSGEEDSYIEFPSGSPVDRARVKKDMLQEIPQGAKVALFKIGSSTFSNGKYKIGWAQYTSDHIQISGTVKGWYTSETLLGVEIKSNAKFFMFYFATVSSSDSIDLENLSLDSISVFFDNSTYDYAKEILHKPISHALPRIEKQFGNEIENLKLSTPSPDYNIFSINHRGYSLEAPENTEPAFILSKKKGFVYVESDVQFTSDNVPVMLHDTTINRTARNADGSAISGTIYLQDITYEQALTYDFGIWMGEEFAGTKILSFEEFIILCKKALLHPFIELKDNTSGNIWTDSRIETVANIVKKYGMSNKVSFISFATSALLKISAYFPHASLGLGYDVGTYTPEGIATILNSAQTLKNGYNEVFVSLNYRLMSSSLYEQVVSAGISPLIWTVNDADTILALNNYVVGVMSDKYNAGQIILEDVLN